MVKQVQTLDVHWFPVKQTLLHPPQLLGSLVVFVHTLLQSWLFVGHAHTPCPLQTSPPLHTRPQPPQLLLSVFVFTHALLQSVRFGPHVAVHTLALHTGVWPLQT